MTDTAPQGSCDRCGSLCKNCQEEADMEFPDGCQCDPGSWVPGVRIHEICQTFRQTDIPGATWCAECQHESECHRDHESMDPNAVDEEQPGRPAPIRGWLEDSGARSR